MTMRIYVSSEEAAFFINNKMGYADRIPTSGSYKVGDFIVSSTQLDGVFGWVCTEEGTPGKWEVIGTAADTTQFALKTDLDTTNNNVTEVTNISNTNKTDISNLRSDLNETDSNVTEVTNIANTANDKADTNKTNIGAISNLNTNIKDNLVNAINELNTKLGDNTELLINLYNNMMDHL